MARLRTKTRATAAPEASVSRRKFMQSVLAASAATSVVAMPGTAAALDSTGASDDEATFKVLSAEQAILLTAVLNRLVPADDEMPAAGDLGVAQFIDGVMHEAPHMRQPILSVIDRVALSGSAIQWNGADLDALLTRVERDDKVSFDALLEVTYTAYYSHPDVLHAIGWIPPGKEADTSEFFDPSLLDDVRKMGPRYRQV